MTKRDLLDLLEGYDDDDQILVMHQEHYPLVEELHGVTTKLKIEYSDAQRSADEDGEEFDPSVFEQTQPTVIYLVVVDGQPRDHSPYGNKIAWDIADRP